MNTDMKQLNNFELLQIRDNATSEIEKRAHMQLEEAALVYIEALGTKEGMEHLGETLLKEVSQKHYPGGWGAFIQFLVKISG